MAANPPAATNVAPAAPAMGAVTPPPAVAAPTPPAASAVPIPARPNWTWTTSDGKVYHNVVVTKIEPDAVTILDDDGGALVPIATLPPDIQTLLGYDPAAAAAASAQRAKDDQYTEVITTQFEHNFTNFSAALAKARAENKLVLIDFTGSDWCPHCMRLHNEVLSNDQFRDYSFSRYVFVTLDYPRSFELPPDLKAQNEQLAHQYSITGYPTLLVLTPEGKELGRTAGYDESAGAPGVIAWLDSLPRG